MKKILITGSSGYIGYVLSKFFSKKGTKVVGLDVAENPVWKGNKNFKFYRCDITDKKRMKEIFSLEKPSCIIHLAYLMNPLHDVKKEYEIDVTGSRNAIQIANTTRTVKQFVQFSSASAYGAWPENELWIKETQGLRPRDYRYGINKKKVEDYYNRFKKRKDMKLVILRMCTAVGPSYHKKGGVVSLIVRSPFVIRFNGRDCEVQFIHEDDLTALLGLIIDDEDIEGTFNLAPDSLAKIKDLAPDKRSLRIPKRLMKGLVGILWSLRIAEMRPAAIELSTYGIIVDPKKLTDRYDYKFKYSTKSGFRDTVKKRRAKGTL